MRVFSVGSIGQLIKLIKLSKRRENNNFFKQFKKSMIQTLLAFFFTEDLQN